MEGAWFLATGRRVSFSEQQILDCSWGYDPHSLASSASCDGGDAWAGAPLVVGGGMQTGLHRTKGAVLLPVGALLQRTVHAELLSALLAAC